MAKVDDREEREQTFLEEIAILYGDGYLYDLANSALAFGAEKSEWAAVDFLEDELASLRHVVKLAHVYL